MSESVAPVSARVEAVSARVEGWGMAVGGPAQVLRPDSLDDIREAIAKYYKSS